MYFGTWDEFHQFTNNTKHGTTREEYMQV